MHLHNLRIYSIDLLILHNESDEEIHELVVFPPKKLLKSIHTPKMTCPHNLEYLYNSGLTPCILMKVDPSSAQI